MLMEKIPDKYASERQFAAFLVGEFEHTAANATMEELAEFAFGSVGEAIRAFEECGEDEG
jgi:hypothetical protein